MKHIFKHNGYELLRKQLEKKLEFSKHDPELKRSIDSRIDFIDKLLKKNPELEDPCPNRSILTELKSGSGH